MPGDAFKDAESHVGIRVHNSASLLLLQEPLQELRLCIAHHNRFMLPCLHQSSSVMTLLQQQTMLDTADET